MESRRITVLRNHVLVRDGTAGRLLMHTRRRGRPIFNPDSKRFQAPLRKSSKLVRDTVRTLVQGGFMHGRKLGACVALTSFSGCTQQQWHTDYDPELIRTLKHKPLGVILAVQDDTFFVEYPNIVHRLNRGDMLVFEGDVIHAGARYDATNTRVHLYIDSLKHLRRPNSTYILRQEVDAGSGGS